MAISPAFSPRYVVPPPAYPFHAPASFNVPALWECRSSHMEPPRAPEAVSALGRAWLDAYPFEVVDLFKTINARTVAEPLKVSGTLGGGLALTSCHLKQIPPAPPGIYDETPSGRPPTEGTESTASSAPEDVVAKKGKKNRFCKGKRDRYRKLVERLIKEARKCPDTFTLEAVQLPQAIVSNEVSKAKLLATVLNFARVDPDTDIN